MRDDVTALLNKIQSPGLRAAAEKAALIQVRRDKKARIAKRASTIERNRRILDMKAARRDLDALDIAIRFNLELKTVQTVLRYPKAALGLDDGN